VNAAALLLHQSTANDHFKQQYARTLRWSLLFALTALILAVWLLPEYRPVPYTLTSEALVVEDLDVLEATVLPPPERRQLAVPDIVPAAPDDPAIRDDIPWPEFLLDVSPTADPEPMADPAFHASSTKPRLLRGAVADYPEMARLAGMQGLVLVKVLVDRDGRVSQVVLLKGVHPLLDRPALVAARQLVFTPGTQRDMPVPCWVAVPFRFALQ
jgi:protein TonB